MKFFRLIFTLLTSSPASPSSSQFHLTRETSELFWKVTKLVDTYNCFAALVHHPAKRECGIISTYPKFILDHLAKRLTRRSDSEQPDNSLCKIARADSLRDFDSLPTTARVNRIERLPSNQTLAHLAVEMMEMVSRMVVLTSSASSM